VHLQYGLINSPDMNPVDGSADRYDRGAGDDALVNTTPDGTGAIALPDPATYEFGYQVGPDYLAVPVGSINRFRLPTTAPATTAPDTEGPDPK
jgi:hypothetical protein